MQLISISLQHFRNYAKKTFTFSPQTTVILGENARGKTNILEAIVLVSTGLSFRAQRIEEMVRWGEEVGRVKAVLRETGSVGNPPDEAQPRHQQHENEVEVVLTTGTVLGEKVQKRKFFLDGTAKQKKDAIGLCTTVLFRPEDLDLISGSPSLRRKFLDNVLSQNDREYRDSLESYEKALLRRNALLDVLREGNTTRAAFAFWDQLMVKHGNVLSEKRREFLEFLNAHAHFPMHFHVEYDSSTISEARLRQYAVEEVAAGYTLVGPHKDDFIVYLENGSSTPGSGGSVGGSASSASTSSMSTSISTSSTVKGKELESYGSRGEQRMAVLWLKVGELAFAEKAKNGKPLLLLDDIFSELDEKHQEMVMQLVDNQQTIITSTEATLPKGLSDGVECIRLVGNTKHGD